MKKPDNLKVIDSLNRWQQKFKTNKLKILNAFINDEETLESITTHFVYENMQMENPNFCPLYKKSKLCHHLKPDKLYCFACDCPHYSLDDSPFMQNDMKTVGKCLVQSKKARYVTYKGKSVESQYAILDCTDCIIPHTKYSAERELKKAIQELAHNSQKQLKS